VNTKGELSYSNEPDPMQNVYGKPMISEEHPHTRYLGRVVIELYESPGASDVNGLAYTIDPASGVNIDEKTLIKRIADALSLRIARNPG
jgi:hypothetical protein